MILANVPDNILPASGVYDTSSTLQPEKNGDITVCNAYFGADLEYEPHGPMSDAAIQYSVFMLVFTCSTLVELVALLVITSVGTPN